LSPNLYCPVTSLFTAQLRKNWIFCKLPGLSQFVKIAGQVAVIPAWQIEALQIFVATYADEIRHEDYRKYRVGDEVIVVAGPLKGIKGRIIAGGRHVRFAVGIDQVRSAFSVTVDVDLIEKLVDKRVTRPE
jgi:transcriptional antiterminator RfaH